MLIDCHICHAKVDAVEHGKVEHEDLFTFQTFLLQCPACKSPIVAERADSMFAKDGLTWTDPIRVYPKPRRLLGDDVPKTIRTSLEEAEKCVQSGAFLAAAAMAGRALEGLCRHFSTKDTYLGSGIKELKEKGLIDARLFEWSEELREARNAAAHATEAAFSAQDAEDLITFTYAIVDYVFLLTQKFIQFQKRKNGGASQKG